MGNYYQKGKTAAAKRHNIDTMISVSAHFMERFMWVNIVIVLWVKCCGKGKDG
jgi:hypothetical protein